MAIKSTKIALTGPGGNEGDKGGAEATPIVDPPRPSGAQAPTQDIVDPPKP